ARNGPGTHHPGMVVRRSRLAVGPARLLADRNPGRAAALAVSHPANPGLARARRGAELARTGGVRMIPYAEFCVTSNFTFLTGASHPEELVTRAAELGLSAVAITDRNSVAGVVRAFSALKELA